MSDEQEEKGLFKHKDSVLISKNLYFFLKDYYNVLELFFFTLDLAHRADKAALGASKALISYAKSDDERERYQSTIDNPSRTVKKFSEFGALNSRNLTVNIVEAFLWYISASIQSAMKKRPELVKSGESVKIEDIFEIRSKRDIVNYLIDRKINSLSYGGMSKIEKFISDSMGIALFPTNEDRELMQIFVEVRNIHVHNRSVVNKVFLGRTTQHEKFKFFEGKRAGLDFDELIDLTRVCVQTAIDLDTTICTKFKIKQKRYPTWDKPQKSVLPSTA